MFKGVFCQGLSSKPKIVNFDSLPDEKDFEWNRFLKSKVNALSKGLIPSTKKQSFLLRLLLFIRGNFFIPDARVLWVKPSIKFLSTYISKHQIDIIITTGPPHSLHLIGLGLKSKHSLKWFADFRDPWTAIGYHNQLKLSKSSQKKHLAL